jgi:hypothetical protein
MPTHRGKPKLPIPSSEIAKIKFLREHGRFIRRNIPSGDEPSNEFKLGEHSFVLLPHGERIPNSKDARRFILARKFDSNSDEGHTEHMSIVQDSRGHVYPILLVDGSFERNPKRLSQLINGTKLVPKED